jgi:hypothetical protein
MSDWQPVINAVSGIPVAILTAWLAVKFSIRRFQSEKWFERRVDAYMKVIEALHFMKHCTERQLRAEERGTELPREVEEELKNSYLQGLSDLRKLTDMGAILFSAEAVSVLDTLSRELKEASTALSFWEHLDSEGAAISKALTELRPIAKKDLNAQ